MCRVLFFVVLPLSLTNRTRAQPLLKNKPNQKPKKISLLRRLTLEDAAGASHMFTLLMGDKVAPRRALIEEHGSRLLAAEALDI
jgi:hypothetical protein